MYNRSWFRDQDEMSSPNITVKQTEMPSSELIQERFDACQKKIVTLQKVVNNLTRNSTEVIDNILPLTEEAVVRNQKRSRFNECKFQQILQKKMRQTSDLPSPSPSCTVAVSTSFDDLKTDKLVLRGEQILRRLQERDTSDGKVISFGKDSNKFLTIFKDNGLTLPSRYFINQRISYLLNTKGSYISTTNFETALLEAFYSITILTKPLKQNTGDFYFALKLLTFWYSSFEPRPLSYTGMIQILPDALEQYLTTHFKSKHPSKAIVFTPNRDTLDLLIGTRDPTKITEDVLQQMQSIRQTDEYKYQPYTWLRDGNIKYPPTYTDKTWPLDIMKTLLYQDDIMSDQEFRYICSLDHVKRYALWGMATLALVQGILGGKDRFRQYICPYLLTFDGTEKMTTTGQIFPGLYKLLVCSRPELTTSEANQTMLLSHNLYLNPHPKCPSQLQMFIKYFETIEKGRKSFSDVSSNSKVQKVLLDYQHNIRDVLFQHLEIVMNTIFNKVDNPAELFSKLKNTTYNFEAMFSDLTQVALVEYLITGFRFTEVSPMIDPEHTGLLKKDATKILHQVFAEGGEVSLNKS